MLGVTIIVDGENIHTYKDWGLKWYGLEISSPDPKTNYIDIPGGDGKLDLSEALTGDIKYDNRKIKLKFDVDGDYYKWIDKSSEIMNFIHGKKAKIILDTDPSFYWYGRIELSSGKEDFSLGELEITADVEPYKNDLISSLEDWKWDIFNFETGVIRDYRNLNVDGKLKVVIPGTRKKICPTIQSTSNMELWVDGNIINIKQGTYRYWDIVLSKEDNILTFKGVGAISIEYRGGSL